MTRWSPRKRGPSPWPKHWIPAFVGETRARLSSYPPRVFEDGKYSYSPPTAERTTKRDPSSTWMLEVACVAGRLVLFLAVLYGAMIWNAMSQPSSAFLRIVLDPIA